MWATSRPAKRARAAVSDARQVKRRRDAPPLPPRGRAPRPLHTPPTQWESHTQPTGRRGSGLEQRHESLAPPRQSRPRSGALVPPPHFPPTVGAYRGRASKRRRDVDENTSRCIPHAGSTRAEQRARCGQSRVVRPATAAAVATQAYADVNALLRSLHEQNVRRRLQQYAHAAHSGQGAVTVAVVSPPATTPCARALHSELAGSLTRPPARADASPRAPSPPDFGAHHKRGFLARVDTRGAGRLSAGAPAAPRVVSPVSVMGL